MGNGSDSIMPFVDGKFVVLRMPYPSGLFPKNVDGRIDDPRAGWKGRGLWTTTGTRTPFHLEGGKQRPKAIKRQPRPDPLARQEILSGVLPSPLCDDVNHAPSGRQRSGAPGQ
jgi:hypothetical protein